jgi:phage baseplate assembly protein V
MSADLMNQMKIMAHGIASRIGAGRWGTVTNTRKTDTGYEVRVQLQPEQVLTGWLPVLSHMVGNGWGIVAPPTLNSQAFILPDGGRADHGVVVGLGYSTEDMPPQPGNTPVSEGQFALVHKNGSYLLFNDDDVVLVTNRDLNATVGRDLTAGVGRNMTATVAENATVKAGQSITLSAPAVNGDSDGNGGKAQWNLHADVHVNGDVFDAHGAVSQLRGHYNQHIHSDSHGDTTGTPTPQD